MANLANTAETELVSGLTIKHIIAPKGIGQNYEITFTNGSVMHGPQPLSSVGLYKYDVKIQAMRYGKSIILEWIPYRLPLNITRLSTLISACGVDYSLEDLVCDPEKFDTGLDAPDQTDALRQNYPDLIEMLESHAEGIIYFRFEEAKLLAHLYEVDLIKKLRADSLKATAHLAKNNPALLAFKITTPNCMLPEIDLEQFDSLKKLSGHKATFGERSALVLYNWLKTDRDRNGHTFSYMSQVPAEAAFAAEEGFEFLIKHNVIVVENNKEIFLTEVLQWEETIKVSLAKLKERFTAAKDDVPKRDQEYQPYEKKDELVNLDEHQEAALRLLKRNSSAILSGGAGTGKTTILAYLASEFAPGTILGCAPTNRAARELTKRVLPSRTIHRLLYDLLKGALPEASTVRILLIDESSMIPLRLASHLLEVIVNRCPNLQRVYWIGDIAQLDPVEAGSVLVDIAGSLPLFFLEKNHRVSEASQIIHENALKIRDGDPVVKFDDKIFMIRKPTGSLFNDLEKLIKRPGLNQWNTHIISPYRDRKNQDNIYDVNLAAKLIFTGKSHQTSGFCVGDKILCTRNYHNFNIINGDFFKIVSISMMSMVAGKPTEVGKPDCTNTRVSPGGWFRLHLVYAPLTNEENAVVDKQPVITIDTNEVPLSSFALGYCTTNHQTQGLSVGNAVFICTRDAPFVNRKHFYTSVTRAKESVGILTEESIFSKRVAAKVFPRRSKFSKHLEKDRIIPTGVDLRPFDEDRIEFLLSEVLGQGVLGQGDDNQSDNEKKRKAE